MDLRKNLEIERIKDKKRWHEYLIEFTAPIELLLKPSEPLQILSRRFIFSNMWKYAVGLLSIPGIVAFVLYVINFIQNSLKVFFP